MIKERLNRNDVVTLLKGVNPLDDYSIEAVRALAELELEDDVPYNRVIEYAYDSGASVSESAGVCEINMPGRETVYISAAGDFATLSELDGAGLFTVPGVTPYTFRDIANMLAPEGRKLRTYIKRLLNTYDAKGIDKIVADAGDCLDFESAYAFAELAREYYEKEIKPYEND